MFPFGGHKWVAWDFEGQDVEPEEVREAMRLKRKAMVSHLMRLANIARSKKQEDEPVDPERKTISEMLEEKESIEASVQRVQRRHVSFAEDSSLALPTDGICSPNDSASPTEIGQLSRVDSERAMTMIGDASVYKGPSRSIDLKDEINGLPLHTSNRLGSPTHPRRNFLNRRLIIEFLKALFSPASVAIISSFPIALIPQLKALFVEVPGTYMPSAPDGQPPLAFFLDATSFVGAASVPLGLICLGSSLARLNMPRKGEWETLPLGAIICIAIGKMILMPVLGVLICQGLTHAGVISKDDKVLRFVCMFVYFCLRWMPP
jgi:predicted permease